ncbi:ubiquitin carboxyl-terminal hydrolase 20 isoform X2 [Teleopsis dalmanni]|uniref:ubiquitin carboxyl-terminal hydrolase 20 isoform X2 n=1 Tax=Teleopsis dalmanni TaxID=139649 RepID=UPI0018CF3004|nr:ubiquitin carboxyl-terminal hydrolase 20 isoform X2 [Teleopsis dalmanni]
MLLGSGLSLQCPHANNAIVPKIDVNNFNKRTWCYMCEREIIFEEKLNHNIQFDEAMPTLEFSQENEDTPVQAMGLVGLQNIANTCYMNSALQALSNVQPMTNYFLSCSELGEGSIELDPSRNKVGLAKSYQKLMQDIWRKRDEKDFITPRDILRGIRSVQPMFHGFQQHDTQEFLRCFMNQLHEELKGQSPYLQHVYFKSDDTDKNQLNSDSEDCLSSVSSSSCEHSMSETDYETCESSVSDNILLDLKSCANNLRRRIPYKKTNSNLKCINGSQSHSTHRSIITDLFDGKLLSSVQCLTCDRISTREETFQDLSLPIPNRDHLNMLHQTHSVSAQSINSLDSTASTTSNGWLSWIWKIIRSWIWGPSVNLHDCMASFFSADELKGDNMYSCEKCNKLRTGIKYSQIIELPEVLCIHLKRFRHDLLYSSKISSNVIFPLEELDMRPFLHKNCSSQISLYNLSSVICHHGTVGSGHYTCFARNVLTDRWYEYDDHNVIEVPANYVQNCQAYVLFYRKYNPHIKIIRERAIELSDTNPDLSADIRFYIAREWLIRFQTFAEPGPINNWDMLCPHGGLIYSKFVLLNQIAVPVSQPLWDYLYSIFGGGPVINMIFECEVCKRAIEALERRQNYELLVFTKYKEFDKNFGENAIYAISMPWLRKWQHFSRGLTHKTPGPIINSNIVSISDTSRSTSPIRNVRPGSDYAQISEPLWRFLHSIYGGGPEIILKSSPVEQTKNIDCDKFVIKNSKETVDNSDTESNVEQNLQEEIDRTSNEIYETINDVEMKTSKDLSTQAPTISKNDLTSNYKKISRKSKMQNCNLFGTPGNYVIQDEFNKVENKKNEDDSLLSFQDQSFSPEVKKTVSYSNSSGNLRNRRKKFRPKDKVMLQKFTSLLDDVNSTEADA